MRKQCAVWLAAVVMLGVTGGAEAKSAQIALQRNLVYATVDGADGRPIKLECDLARPPEGTGPFPLVVCMHAGGWQLGDKKSYDDVIREFAGRGYVAATINYRLAPAYAWPAQLEDVRSAVKYFRSHAAEYGIDPARVGAVGDDAGGHLALMTGLTGTKDGKDVPVEQSGRVQAVVNFFGPMDLRNLVVPSAWVRTQILVAFGRSMDRIVEELVGTADRSAPQYAAASPVAQVGPGTPPTLTIIGTKDPLIPIEQAKSFHAALKQAGVPEELMVVNEAEHNRDSLNHYAAADARMYEFFDQYLKAGTKAR